MPTKPRIQLIDALRGIAIIGILLLHHIEHFDFFSKPNYNYKWLLRADAWIWNNLSNIISGKAFAMFSLLFGISFWIINENRLEKGQKYFVRHIWRMIILALIGCLHIIFFKGDILLMYAILGIPLLLSKFMSNKAILSTALVLLINPTYIYYLLSYLFKWEIYDWKMPYPKSNVGQILGEGTFFEVAKANFSMGYLESIIWTWNVGRFFTIPGLFFLGVYIRKKRFLTKGSLKSWYKVLIISIAFVYLFSFTDTVWIKQIANKVDKNLFKFINQTYARLSLMFTYLTIIVILWRHNNGNLWIKNLCNFGRMGLTNYVLMSILGSFLYYGWGLGIYKYCGALISFLIGLACLVIQMTFSNWWIKKYQQGPLEKLWRKLTWAKLN